MYLRDNFKTYNYEKNANNSSLNNFIQNLIGRFKPMQNFLTPKFTNLKKKEMGLSYKKAHSSSTRT